MPDVVQHHIVTIDVESVETVSQYPLTTTPKMSILRREVASAKFA